MGVQVVFFLVFFSIVSECEGWCPETYKSGQFGVNLCQQDRPKRFGIFVTGPTGAGCSWLSTILSQASNSSVLSELVPYDGGGFFHPQHWFHRSLVAKEMMWEFFDPIIESAMGGEHFKPILGTSINAIVFVKPCGTFADFEVDGAWENNLNMMKQVVGEYWNMTPKVIHFNHCGDRSCMRCKNHYREMNGTYFRFFGDHEVVYSTVKNGSGEEYEHSVHRSESLIDKDLIMTFYHSFASRHQGQGIVNIIPFLKFHPLRDEYCRGLRWFTRSFLFKDELDTLLQAVLESAESCTWPSFHDCNESIIIINSSQITRPKPELPIKMDSSVTTVDNFQGRNDLIILPNNWEDYNGVLHALDGLIDWVRRKFDDVAGIWNEESNVLVVEEMIENERCVREKVEEYERCMKEHKEFKVQVANAIMGNRENERYYENRERWREKNDRIMEGMSRLCVLTRKIFQWK